MANQPKKNLAHVFIYYNAYQQDETFYKMIYETFYKIYKMRVTRS
jgi:hypothetical protein